MRWVGGGEKGRACKIENCKLGIVSLELVVAIFLQCFSFSSSVSTARRRPSTGVAGTPPTALQSASKNIGIRSTRGLAAGRDKKCLTVFSFYSILFGILNPCIAKLFTSNNHMYLTV